MKPLPFRKPLSFRPLVAEGPTNDVVTALTEQVDCYRRLEKLAQVQHEHVRREQIEALLDVLNQRQLLLGQLARLEQIVAPAKRAWTEFVSPLSPEQRALAENLLAETRTLLESITSSDKNDVLALQQRKLNLGKQIGKATVAKQMNRNIATAAYGPARTRMDISQ